jgi:nucleoid DNA-binding protein
VTKKEIVKTISEEIGLTQLKTKEIVQKTFDAIVEALVEEGRIELRNFGVFEVKKRAARKARNPSSRAKRWKSESGISKSKRTPVPRSPRPWPSHRRDPPSKATPRERASGTARNVKQQHALASFPRRHIFTVFIRVSISTSGTSSPCPLPGQISHVCFQAAGVLMFDPQNGHVRHCCGRSS